MIKTKLVGLVIMVGNKELKVGDKVLMDNKNQTEAHGKIYEVIGIKKGEVGIRTNYYEIKSEDGNTLEVEARWFDSSSNKTYLVEE